MYKLLLCWRYLKTRYLAMACIISVMLGVATLIVVNSVMAGFSTKLRERLHGLLSDVVIEARGLEGFRDPEGKMEKILQDPFLGQQVAAMTPTLEVFAMIQYPYRNGEMYTRPVRLIGVNPAEREKIGSFKDHLVFQKEKAQADFEPSPEAKKRFAEREKILQEIAQQERLREQRRLEEGWERKVEELKNLGVPQDQWPARPLPEPAPTPSEAKPPQGCYVGNLIVSYRQKAEEGKTRDCYLVEPGDSVILTTVGGQKLTPVYDSFIVVDYFKSEMSEYDSQYVFVSLDYLQHLRSMPDRVTSIQIKLKDFGQAKAVVEKLEKLFPFENLEVATWEDKQGPLLQAIAIEKGILNVLLFLIIAVAGFGILAIFSMIVAEKTRDIGILKALGASNGGVMKIFLGYGLLLGIVGGGLGSVLGVALTVNINNVEQFLSTLTGKEIFDRTIYYFREIPYHIQPIMLVLVNVGAVLVAVTFSVLPALRAALLHPVRALRYE